MALDYGNFEVVKSFLDEALCLCTTFRAECNKKAVLKEICLSLEKASAMVCSPRKQKAPIDVDCIQLCKFKGLYEYHKAKLVTCPPEVDEFLTKTLPCIIRLAKRVQEEGVNIPADLQNPCNFSTTKSSDMAEVYEVEICRGDVATALACMFLCLVANRTDEQKHERPDYSAFFSGLDGHKMNGQTAKYLMVIEYFRYVADNGPPAGCVSFSKLIGKKGYVPSNIREWRCVQNRLCNFIVENDGSLDDRASEVLQTDFANYRIGGHTLSGSVAQEEIMFCACPELQVSMLFISRLRTLEAIQMKGFQQFSTYSGYGRALRFTGPCVHRTRSRMSCPSPAYVTAIDAWSYHGDAEEQYTDNHVYRDINKALVGFTQPQDMQVTGSHDLLATENKPTSQDLSAISRYADSLTEKLMTDITSSLQLVIPDYFGFNVIHYDPLKENYTESEQTGDCSDPACDSDTSQVAVDPATVAANSTGELTSPLPYSMPIDSGPQPIQTDVDAVSMKSASDGLVMESLANYANDVSIQIIKDSLDTFYKKTGKPRVTGMGDGLLPRVEVTAKTSSSPVPISVDVEMSVTTGCKTVSFPTKRTIPVDVKISTTTSNNQSVDINMDTGNGPGTNIGIQIYVTPNTGPAECREGTEGYISTTDMGTQANAAQGHAEDKPNMMSYMSQPSIDSPLSTLSLSDSVKHELTQQAQSMADDILFSVYEELRERRRLFIENNISSVDFSAAQTTSAGVVGQIFEELQTEAANSISDSEKLLKVPDNQLETFAESLVTSVITETQAEWLPQVSTNLSVSNRGAQARTQVSPRATVRSQSMLSPTGYRDLYSQRKLSRRSSAPVAIRRSSLESITRRVSEPSVSFRSRSSHSDSGAKYSDYMKQEFCQDKKGASSSSLSSSGSRSAVEHLWAEFNRRSSDENKLTALPETMRSPKSDSRSQSSHQTLPSCEEEDDMASSDGIMMVAGGDVTINRQISLVLPAITVDRPATGASSNSSSLHTSSSHDAVQFDLSSQGSDTPSPLVSPLQHQYLKLYSEVLAENILHESLGNVQQNMDLSQPSKLTEVVEEEETDAEMSEALVSCIRPVASGNWGCGAFGGDPQLKSMMQWMAATRASVPQLIYYTFGDVRVRQLQRVVRSLQHKRVCDLMALILDYCQLRRSRRSCGTLFDYIESKQACP